MVEGALHLGPRGRAQPQRDGLEADPAVTRDAVEELGLAPGVQATAAVKATSVMIERSGA